MQKNAKEQTHKRLIFDVPVDVHSRLKAEAAQAGVHLGPYCASILSGQGQSAEPESVEKLETGVIASLPLDLLREMCHDLAKNRPHDWQREVNKINSEIRRRFRV